MSWKQLCRTCNLVPVAFTTVEFCFGCWPGGPATAPPCLECGSQVDYFTNGLCGRCHRNGPNRVDACPDCFAWGATRHRSWRCIACNGWHEKRQSGICVCCRRRLPINTRGGC